MSKHYPPEFGVSLDVVMRRPTERILPSIVKGMMYFLLKSATTSPSPHHKAKCRGLFRIKAPEADVEALCTEFRHSHLPYISNPRLSNPHIVATAFKRYFRELPGNLLSPEIVPKLVDALGSAPRLRAVLKSLHVLRFNLTSSLFYFLNYLTSEPIAAVNQMTPHEMAVAWCETLVPFQTDNGGNFDVFHLKRLTLLEALITSCDEIFSTKEYELMKRGRSSEKEEQVEKNLAFFRHVDKLASNVEVFVEEHTNSSSSSLTQDLSDLHQEMTTATPEPLYHIPQLLSCTTLALSGHFSLTGRRPQMEDRVIHFDDLNAESALLSPAINRSMYAVYDGHAGMEVAIMAEKYIHTHIIRNLADPKRNHDVLQCLWDGVVSADTRINAECNAENIKSGSTMVLVYIENEELYVSNLGDSEAIMNVKSDDESQPDRAQLLSFKHKPDDIEEVDRMQAGGALVARGRVFGKLAVSRALGDSDFKIPKASANHVSNDSYLAHFHLTPKNDLLVVACDGLWDILTYQEAMDIALRERKNGKSPEEVAEILTMASYDGGSQDNISTIVVYLDWEKKPIV